MKNHITNPFTCLSRASRTAWVLPTLIIGLGWMLVGPLTAQTFTILHGFTAFDETYRTNSDGFEPAPGLLLAGNVLYGTANFGGSSGNGTVFAVNTDGTGFTNLHNFTPYSGPLYTNSDGSFPNGGLILSGNTLYGTAFNGGSSGNGTVYAVRTNGTGFTNLHIFTASDPVTGSNSDGANPVAGLLLSGNTLYGTASAGGGSGAGAVFAVNTDGTSFTNLCSFSGGQDGNSPYGGLVLSGNTLYGTTVIGGSSSPGSGTVFAVNTDGTGFTALHHFSDTSGPTLTNSDGARPYDGLILSGNTLYGTASRGGTNGSGTLFAVNTNGTGFTNLHTFAVASGSFPYLTNSDGVNPQYGFTISGNTLYGTTGQGSTNGSGTVFALNTNGTGFTTLYTFTTTRANSSGVLTNSDGGGPQGALFLSGDTLYGTAAGGGSSGSGTVFSLSFPPQLTIIRSAANVVLTWLTNNAGFDYTGYTLESTTNLRLPAVWTTNSPVPVVVNGQNTVTNPITGTQRFFRLSSP